MLRSSGDRTKHAAMAANRRIVQANGARRAAWQPRTRRRATRHRPSVEPTSWPAARELYEEQGLSKTSVQDITNRMGVARSLFYHYFPDKEAVTSAVLDDYVADFIEATHYWNAQRHPGDIESAFPAS